MFYRTNFVSQSTKHPWGGVVVPPQVSAPPPCGGAAVPGPGGPPAHHPAPHVWRPLRSRQTSAVLRAPIRPSRRGWRLALRAAWPPRRPGFARRDRGAGGCAAWLGLSARGPCASLPAASPPGAACGPPLASRLPPLPLRGRSGCGGTGLRSWGRPAGLCGPPWRVGLGPLRASPAPVCAAAGTPLAVPACGPGSSACGPRPGLVAPRGRCGPAGRPFPPPPPGLGVGISPPAGGVSWSGVAVILPVRLPDPPAAHWKSPGYWTPRRPLRGG